MNYRYKALIKKLANAVGVALLTINSGLQAGPLSLSQVPLFLSEQVPPNIFFQLDNSGSMDFEMVMRSHWRACNYDNLTTLVNGSGASLAGDDNCDAARRRPGPWFGISPVNNQATRFDYFFKTDDNIFVSVCTEDDVPTTGGLPYFINGQRLFRSSIEACPSSVLDHDWRPRSAAMAALYYNPEVEYEPWEGPCKLDNTPCADANFNSARSNPREGTAGYPLTRNLTGFTYFNWIDNRGFTGNRPRRGANFNATTTPNGVVDLWDSNVKVEFQNGNKVILTRTDYNPSAADPAAGLNPTVGASQMLNGGACFPELGGGSIPCRTIAEAKQNIANWYSYYRRPQHAVKNSLSQIITQRPGFRYGMSVINHGFTNPLGNQNPFFLEMPPANTVNLVPHNENLIRQHFDFELIPFGTPLRRGLIIAGEYYSNNLPPSFVGPGITPANPIINSCQKNFTVLFSDGFYNGGDPVGFGDVDQDGLDNRFSDIAKYYYDTDLDTTLANNVPPDAFDDNPQQHMVTFTTTFGVFGNLVDVNGDNRPDIGGDVNVTLNERGQQVDPNTGAIINAAIGGWTNNRVDDLWHGAFNSRGTFASAADPQELTKNLFDVIDAIGGRLSSASAVALNTGTLSTNSRIYQARFDSTTWSGQLASIPISDGTGNSTCSTEPVGEVCPQEWEAGSLLSTVLPASRQIMTSTTSGATGIEFLWPELDSAQQDLFRINPDTGATDPASVAQARIDYLRGDPSNEGTSLSNFRQRNGLILGDIINSSPVFVASPPFFYPANLESVDYADFRADYLNRQPMVYVGSNDGMLHGFNANTGEEVFAYIPSTIMGNLNELTSTNYNHRFYVDGAINVIDAFFGGAWHSVLTAGLGAGGQGVFALNVSNPNDTARPDPRLDNAANADQILLWEFDDTDDADMGNVLGRVVVARMQNGQWVGIFGNGLNNTAADGNVSATGNAVLYIVDIATGNLIRKIDTAVGTAQDPEGASRPNGLAEPAAVDLDGDSIVDFIYAGDFFGNLWKFDVRSSSPINWGVEYGSGSGRPLFVATDGSPANRSQPITAGVNVARHPTDPTGTLVFFGTGKYVETSDNMISAAEPTQSFYGVYDRNLTTSEPGYNTSFDLDRDDLVQHEILQEVTVSGNDFRITSSAEDGTQYSIDWATDDGWFIDLINNGAATPSNQGERVVTRPIIRGDRIIFVTLVPSDVPCQFGGTSWLMELDWRTGSRLESSPLDVNDDGIINEMDLINDEAISGLQFDEIIKNPAILSENDGGGGGGGGGASEGDCGQVREFKLAGGSSGNVSSTLEQACERGLGRQSWRQLR